jgi:hypothetical protein
VSPAGGQVISWLAALAPFIDAARNVGRNGAIAGCRPHYRATEPTRATNQAIREWLRTKSLVPPSTMAASTDPTGQHEPHLTACGHNAGHNRDRPIAHPPTARVTKQHNRRAVHAPGGTDRQQLIPRDTIVMELGIKGWWVRIPPSRPCIRPAQLALFVDGSRCSDRVTTLDLPRTAVLLTRFGCLMGL